MRSGEIQIIHTPGMGRFRFVWAAETETDTAGAADMIARTLREWINDRCWYGTLTLDVRLITDLELAAERDADA